MTLRRSGRGLLLALTLVALACGDPPDDAPGTTSESSTTTTETTTTTTDADESSSTTLTPDVAPACVCDNDLCVDGVCAQLVFVTDAVFATGTGTQAATDACTTVAITAGLAGTFTAWISDSAMSAAERVPGPGPFALLDGTLVADDLADLLDGELAVGIGMSELGAEPPLNPGCVQGVPGVWTGSAADGSLIPDACVDWTGAGGMSGRAGSAGPTDATWTDGCNVGCATMQHYYCMQTDDPAASR